MNASELRIDQRVRKSRRELVREAFVTGLAVVVPLLVTAIVLAIAFQFVHDALSLFARAAIVAGDGTNGDDGESPAHKSTERGSLC